MPPASEEKAKLLHRFVTSPAAGLAVGVFMLVAAAVEFVQVGLAEERHVLAHSSHGVGLLGLTVLLSAAENLFSGAQMGAVSSLTLTGGRRIPGQRWLGRVVGSATYEVILAALIIACGFAEVIEDVHNSERLWSDDRVWHYALIAIGVVGLFGGAARVLEALEFLEDTERQGVWHLRAVGWLGRWLRRPLVLVTLACAVILLTLLEQVLALVQGEELGLEAHHGLLLYGVRALAQGLPDLFYGTQLLDDYDEAWGDGGR